jgi:hypothetical protein
VLHVVAAAAVAVVVVVVVVVGNWASTIPGLVL